MSTDNLDNEQKFDGIAEGPDNPPPMYFKVLLAGLVVWGVAYAAYFLMSGWSSSAEFDQKMINYKAQYSTNR